jgi:TetR/AcrR family transcriptional regulator, fatty acid metabolism regulator protein
MHRPLPWRTEEEIQVSDTKGNSDKRERILSAAVACFARHGFYRTRVKDIAKDAGVADGTVYLYFRNKEALLESIFSSVMEGFLARARSRSSAGSAPERLAVLVELHLTGLGADRDLATVFQIELRHSARLMESVGQGHLRDYFQLIAGILEAGQREGSVRTGLDTRFAARCIFGLVDETVTAWILHGADQRLEERIAPLLDFIFHGLLGGGSGE